MDTIGPRLFSFRALAVAASMLLWLPMAGAAIQDRSAKAAPGAEAATAVSPAQMAGLTAIDWRVRMDAIDAIADRGEEVAPWAERTLADADPRLRAASVTILARVRAGEGLRQLARVLADKDESVRLALSEALGECAVADAKSPSAHARLTMLGNLSADTSLRVRLAAIDALGHCAGAPDATKHLLKRCQDASEEEAAQAIDRLIALGAPKLVETVQPWLNQSKTPNRVLAANALGRIASPPAVQALLAGLANQDAPSRWDVRAAICDSLGMIAPTDPAMVKRMETALLPLLEDERWGVRASAAYALGRVGSAAAVPALIAIVDRKDNRPLKKVLQQMANWPIERQEEWVKWYSTHKKDKPIALPAPREESEIYFYELKDVTSNVVFVIDTSGSMVETRMLMESHSRDKVLDTKLQAASAELYKTVLELEPGTRFNVVWFGSEAQLWQSGPVRATWRVKAKVKEWLDILQPAGATASQAALNLALDQPDVETIYFLTDGMPTAGETDIQKLSTGVTERNRTHREAARIHTIAFFLAQGEAFLSQLAALNHGLYRLQN
jgi:HEAT repeat protein